MKPPGLDDLGNLDDVSGGGNALDDWGPGPKQKEGEDAEQKKGPEGQTMTVTIRLEHLGRYSDTAPYNCEKSRRILRRGVKALYEKNKLDKGGLGILCLLAADDPTIPDSAKYQARAKEWAHQLEYIDGPWFSGPQLIALSEYYMKTGDEAIFPKLVKAAENHARGVSWFGTTGHKFCDLQPDGSPGRLSGYGPINCSGALGFLGLSLARKAGVDSPVVDAANERQRKFFGHFALHSGIGYGEMPYAIAGGRGDVNGKLAMSGLALGLQEGQQEKAKYCTRMTTLASYNVRQYAHGGSFFGQVWHPVGAAQGGVKTANLQFREIRWHLDLKRRWDHTRIYDSSGNDYGDFSYAATALLFYAMPLKQLYITGRGQNESLKLNDAEFDDLLAIQNFSAAEASNEELIAELSRHQGMTRVEASQELADRIKKDPGSAEAAALIDQILVLAADTEASTSGRAGACTTLMFLKDRARGPVAELKNAEIAKTMVDLLKDPDPYIRFGGVRAMQQMDPNAIRPHASAIMDAIIATGRPTFPLDEEDPCQWAHGEMGAFLFGSVLNGTLDGVDRTKLIPAVRSSLKTPNGGARNRASRILDRLTMQEVRELGDVLVDNIRVAPPANAMGGTSEPESQAAMAKYLFEEALPLSLIYGGGAAVKNRIPEKYGRAAFDMHVARKLMQALGELMLLDAAINANEVIDQMRQTPAPEDLRKLKTIHSVTVAQPTLKLPEDSTELVADARNYAFPNENDTTYTWRKVYGAGKVAFTPNGSGQSKKTTVSFTDRKPGKYRFEVTMCDTLGYTEVSRTVDVILHDAAGKLPANHPPKATSQTLSAEPGQPIPIDLSGTDPDGDDLGYRITKHPAHGRLSGVGGTLTYLANYGAPQTKEKPTKKAAPKQLSLDDMDIDGFGDVTDTGAASLSGQDDWIAASKDYKGSTWTDSFTFEAIDGQGERASGTIQVKVSDKNVGVAVYEGFDYPAGSIHGRGQESSFGFNGPWANSRGQDGYRVSAEPLKEGDGKRVSVSYSSLPSTGRRLAEGQSHTHLSRVLDRERLSALKMLDPGSELWFSFFISEFAPRSVTFSAGPGTSFGAEIGGRNARIGVYATLNGEEDASSRNAWSRSASLRFPEGPNMIVGRCTWGKTDEDPDTVELFRVFDAPGYDLVFLDNPVSSVQGRIPQEDLDSIIINFRVQAALDEIRIGPTLHSVMTGTKPLQRESSVLGNP